MTEVNDVLLDTESTNTDAVTTPPEAAPEEDFSLEEFSAPEEKKAEMVPLAKYLEEKSARKALQAELIQKDKAGETLTNSTLDELSKEYDVDPTYAKKLAAQIKAETLNELKPLMEPILAERQRETADKSFNQAFDSLIVTKYGDQIDREKFKAIALNAPLTQSLGLKSFNDIVKAYYSNVQPIVDKVNEETVEGGSKPTSKEESINFANMTAEQHSKVLADSKQRAKYYEWKDSGGV